LQVAVVVVALAALAGCGGKSRPAGAATPPVAAQDRYGTLWLCRPGLANDPCAGSLAATVLGAKSGRTVQRSLAAAKPSIDCFYVYPTVSPERTVNANLAIQPQQREVAVAQASRFSQVCRVYAPVYRQITLNALSHPKRITAANALVAYSGVLAAFRDYLEHYNDGRGVVLIGHSQGAVILIKLLQQEMDGNAALRKRLVSALLLGGNVTVRRGSTTGGDFQHIPACTSASETGCIVAYSSFARKPPVDSQFARTTSDSGVGLLAPGNPSPDLQIMCVNPAALDGSGGMLQPYFPTLLLALLPGSNMQGVRTPWIAFPGEYTGHCMTSGDATWLQVSPVAGSIHPFKNVPVGVIGLHLIDVNIALGNLVRLVGDQAAAFARK
jgi:pimeloyl-ACP methyl ester carboxylesterase